MSNDVTFFSNIFESWLADHTAAKCIDVGPMDTVG